MWPQQAPEGKHSPQVKHRTSREERVASMDKYTGVNRRGTHPNNLYISHVPNNVQKIQMKNKIQIINQISFIYA